MKKTSSQIAGLLLTVWGSYLYAQDTTTLSLDEAMDLGIQNSKVLKISQSEIDDAMANAIKAKNQKLPDFKISGAALALTQAKADVKILPQSSGGNSMATPNSAYYGSANFSIPLYAGGRINNMIKAADYQVEASKLATENEKLAIAYNVAQAYNNLYKAEQSLRVLKENLKASEERDKKFLNLENNGVIARNDRLKANLQTSDIELKILEAQNKLDLARIQLDLLLGLPEDTKVSVDPNYLSSNLEGGDKEYFLNLALENRKELQINDYQHKATTLNMKAAKAENLPQIALTAGYVAAEIPKIMTVYNAANIGLGVQYNLSNLWKKNTDEMQAKSQLNKLDAQHQLILDQIKLEISQQFQNYELAEKKIAVYEKSLAQANENFRITQNKYNNGLETITELLDADAAQLNASVNLLNAKADAVLAYKKLQQSAGILIQK